MNDWIFVGRNDSSGSNWVTGSYSVPGPGSLPGSGSGANRSTYTHPLRSAPCPSATPPPAPPTTPFGPTRSGRWPRGQATSGRVLRSVRRVDRRSRLAAPSWQSELRNVEQAASRPSSQGMRTFDRPWRGRECPRLLTPRVVLSRGLGHSPRHATSRTGRRPRTLPSSATDPVPG
jgi:hypothetical protein